MTEEERRWEEQRTLWLNKVDDGAIIPSEPDEEAVDWSSIPEESFPYLYQRICLESSPPRRRIPLSFMVKILWHVWQTEDWFPHPTAPTPAQDEQADDVPLVEDGRQPSDE